MEGHFLEYLARYGTPVVFVAQLLGIFGLPIPDELLLTVAGVLIRRGQLNATATLVAAIAGCIAGITVSYVLGRTLGCAAVRRATRGHEAAWHRTQRLFRRFGGWLLAFGYFIPGVRHVTAIAAGTTPLEFRTFSAWAYPGAVIWSTTFVALGYLAGDRWKEMLAAARGGPLIVAAILAAVLVALVLRSRTAVIVPPGVPDDREGR